MTPMTSKLSVWGEGGKDWQLTWLVCFDWEIFQAIFMHYKVLKNTLFLVGFYEINTIVASLYIA